MESGGTPPGAAEPGWHLTVIESSNTAVIRARGELDRATAQELDAALRALQPSVRRLELDLQQLSFVDASGIRLLLGHARRAMAAGVVLTIVRPRPAVMRVLDLSGVTPLLPLVATTGLGSHRETR